MGFRCSFPCSTATKIVTDSARNSSNSAPVHRTHRASTADKSEFFTFPNHLQGLPAISSKNTSGFATHTKGKKPILFANVSIQVAVKGRAFHKNFPAAHAMSLAAPAMTKMITHQHFSVAAGQNGSGSREPRRVGFNEENPHRATARVAKLQRNTAVVTHRGLCTLCTTLQCGTAPAPETCSGLV
jgi:hypothetical protein